MNPMRVILFYVLLNFSFSFGQGTFANKGNVELGLRTTTSVFGHDPYSGLGVGGQTRVQLTDYLNTEWYADWITMDLDGTGTRKNAHIGWSVLFYPKKFGRFIPYLIGGHCFDYAEITPLSTPYLDRSEGEISRWSSAAQMGLGSHYYLSDRFNLSFSAQYMLHLGKHLEYQLLDTENGPFLETKHDNMAQERIEGHLLLTVSLNYKIADLW